MSEIYAPAKYSYSVVLGRFQPLHNGHLEYLLAARAKGDQLIIGITNPDRNRLVHDKADANRSLSDSNPFSYFDRYQMIVGSLMEIGWSGQDFAVVPAPINTPLEMLPYLPAPDSCVICITAYDDWGDRKADLVSGLGYTAEILWRRRHEDRLTSGTKIRDALRTGGNWRQDVPVAVAQYLDESGWTSTLQGHQPG